MLQMGFSRDEIQEALTNNRYDEVMATYLLLDEKRQKLTVRLIFLVLNLLIEYTQGDLLTVKTGDTSIPRKEIKLKCIIQYSQLSANGHSNKPTALLTDAFSNPRFTSQSNSVLTHSCKRTPHVQSLTLGNGICLYFAINQQKIHWSSTEQQNSGDRFCQISICPREICPFWLPNKT